MRDVLAVLAEHHDSGGTYGNFVARETGRSVGTVYPLLTKLEQAGWIVGEWEKVDPREKGEPAIRLWRFTERGCVEFARAHAAELARLRAVRLPSFG